MGANLERSGSFCYDSRCSQCPCWSAFTAASPPVATATVGSVSLGVPASFTNYPFQAYLGNDWVEGRVVDREVLANGDHRWRLQLLAPRHEEVIWMDRAEFLKQLEMHNLKLRLNYPTRKLPTVAPVRGLRQPVGDDWSTYHPLVGNQILKKHGGDVLP